jgi:hypothetical protein
VTPRQALATRQALPQPTEQTESINLAESSRAGRSGSGFSQLFPGSAFIVEDDFENRAVPAGLPNKAILMASSHWNLGQNLEHWHIQ